ncbi:hypothetical protein Hanom_Chr02g00129091 [Helianthus anomalus]
MTMTALFIGFQKRKGSAVRTAFLVEWAARSNRLFDRLVCSIGGFCSIRMSLFERFATIFDISISMDDELSRLEFLFKLLLVPTTISNIQSSLHYHFGFGFD